MLRELSGDELELMAQRLRSQLDQDRSIAEQLQMTGPSLAQTAWNIAAASEARLNEVWAEIQRRAPHG